ncbi:DUF1990 family protein [Lapillicoccus jejuensis]|uniref:Uncharacterized protein (UPF0548 family) n=1 Tax=Lapillicoccus jejuensis TaxID=402171 RepID=A0A542E374_9MICO|nr:DUF1990 domain-containing protein [Lapillicoccus jejuensis]TQJ09781.1 uncharacterized protein (UPF0548 family) [Lapillicoccus jejuensis]
MTPDRERRLRALTPTVDAALRPGDGAPAGFASVRRSRLLPPGLDLDTAAERLLHWRLQRGVGRGADPSSERIEEGTVVDLRIGVGPLALIAPCRVVEVLDEPGRRGFVYVTLPGHPVAGVESFGLTAEGDRVRLTIAAVSRPGSLLTRVAGPLGRLGQALVATAYLHALDDPA